MKDFKVVLRFTPNGVKARCVKIEKVSENSKKVLDKVVKKK
jgi:hypothetical protein